MAGTNTLSIQTGSKATIVDRLERAKRAVKIAVQSPYHRARILGKEVDKTTLETIEKDVDKMISFKDVDNCLKDSSEIYKKLRREVAEIASSSDMMLTIGETTSAISGPLLILPFDFGTKIHNVIRAFFKLAFGEALGQEKFNQKPDMEGSIFKPLKEEVPKLDGVEDKKDHGNSAPKLEVSHDQKSSNQKLLKFIDSLINPQDKLALIIPTEASQTPERTTTEGVMAGQVADQHRQDTIPKESDTPNEVQQLEVHGLKLHRNTGGGQARCLIYSILMGATGKTQSEAQPIVDKIADDLKLPRTGFFAHDSEFGKNIIKEIEKTLGHNICLKVIQNGVDGFMITGEGGADKDKSDPEHCIVIRQTPGHFDAVI